jgi:hypothetical protein
VSIPAILIIALRKTWALSVTSVDKFYTKKKGLAVLPGKTRRVPEMVTGHPKESQLQYEPQKQKPSVFLKDLRNQKVMHCQINVIPNL